MIRSASTEYTEDIRLREEASAGQAEKEWVRNSLICPCFPCFPWKKSSLEETIMTELRPYWIVV